MKIMFMAANDAARVQEIAKAFAINTQTPWSMLEGHLVASHNEYLKPLLGETFYNELVATLETGNELTGVTAQLVQYCRTGVVAYMVATKAALLALRISGLGLVLNTADNTANPTLAEKRLMQSAAAASAEYNAAEIIKLLVKNSGTFPTFQASSQYAEALDGYLNDSETLCKILIAPHSYQLFKILKPSIRAAEDAQVEEILGATLYASLKLKIANKTALTDLEAKVVQYCQQIAALRAIADVLPSIAAQLTPAGLFVPFFNDGVESKQALDDKKEQALLRTYERRSADAINNLVNLLQTNASSFPTYPVKEDPISRIHDNTGRNSIFVN